MQLRGRVNSNLEATVDISVGAPSGSKPTISAVVDTGFTGYLTLSRTVIASLGLQSRQVIQAQLADGSYARMRTYLAEVKWLGRDKRIIVCEGEGGPLLGMALLDGCRLTVEAAVGGDVVIEPM